MNLSKIASILAVGLILPIAAHAATTCPTFSGDPLTSANSGGTLCNELITISNTGVASITVENSADPFDGSDDQLVGVINYDASPVTSLTITGSGIFGFDGDGIGSFTGVTNSQDTSYGEYGGGDAYFSNISGNTGTVDFTSAIGTNGTGYFSLENPPSTAGFTVTTVGATPEPSSLLLMGTGVLGMAGMLRRRIVNAVR